MSWFLHVSFAVVANVIRSGGDGADEIVVRIKADAPVLSSDEIRAGAASALAGDPKYFRDRRSDLWLIRVCDLSHSGSKSSAYPH
jgi:hypothetical protein